MFRLSFPNLKGLTLWTDRRDTRGMPIENSHRHVEDSTEEWFSLRHEDRFVDKVNIKELTETEIKGRRLERVLRAHEGSEWPEKFEVVYRNLAYEFNERLDVGNGL